MQEDFRPILRELLLSHRGLEFLHDTPEFQERYGNHESQKSGVSEHLESQKHVEMWNFSPSLDMPAASLTAALALHLVDSLMFHVDFAAETVIYRIFYHVNRSGNGRLLLRELKRSNLIAALQQVDEEEDINKVLR